MPFHEGVYYPCDSRSSAGIPSVLTSPLSRRSGSGLSVPAPGMTPSGGAPPASIPPFKFRPRRESVDWRRINSVDVELVMSQLDVEALQEHIGAVTFCSLDGERCQRCQSPVDRTLVKLHQLAQLTVEWLLYCQEVLTLHLHAAEERLAAAGREREQRLAQQEEQEERAKAMESELKQRRKIIRSQQSLLTPRLGGGQKCQRCDKSFMNSAFLQNHMQRRHPDEYELQLRSDTEKKSQIESLRVEIGGLKEQIARLQQELQGKAAQEKEQQSLQKDLLRELERFKAEETARMDRKIEDSRDGMRREMEYLYTRNIQAVNEANQNQTAKYEKPAGPERDVDNYKEMQLQMRKQDKKWESKLQDSKAEHQAEKNQLLNEMSRVKSVSSEYQERNLRLQREIERHLQEKEQTVREQREQLRDISPNPPSKVVEVPVVVGAPVLEPKPKRVLLDEPACALKLDPIQELSEEEKDSSLSERRAAEKEQRAAPNALRDSNIKKDLRPDIEQAVVVRMESLGVKPDQGGLKTKRLSSILAEMHSRRQDFAKGAADYANHREQIVSAAEQKLDRRRGGSGRPPETQATPRRPAQGSHLRPRSSSLPSRATQVKSRPAAKQPKTPQPAPRTRTPTQPKTSTPSTAGRNVSYKTPPFSSDEDSEEPMNTDAAQQPRTRQRGSPQWEQPRAAHRASPDRRPVATQSFSSVRQQAAAARTQSDEDEDKWSDDSEVEEIFPTQLQRYKDQNGNVDKRRLGDGNKVNELARSVERQLAGRAVKKPPGGVSVLPERNDDVQELTCTDLEESSEWMVSSLEEVPKPARPTGPLRKSLESSSTSVWGSSAGKGPKTAGTGSTLKSTLCSLSDFSDSEDASSTH
ncbi:cilium assembly protein DZIP1 [Brachionichthys hirsutus]|uniref:cilium assembly protein DZIP1 n=1 Tax=Brachionichthys hirsutus TaxID=412623 RepID=UPI003604E62F